MIEIIKKSECCGCHGCINVCPKNCISMKIDNEGFWYPIVDKDKCIGCNLCVKVCPEINIPKRDEYNTIAYACKNKNEDIRKNSSSGGIFTLLCEEVINNNGVVFGASFDESFNVRHTYTETIEECNQFRGAKYVQSKIGDTYKRVKEFLDNDRIVLFSGTPCQISGIDAYLRKKYNNLFLIDIACHGVPSPLIYKKYINTLKQKNRSNIKHISFRDKQTGWSKYSFNLIFENGIRVNQLGGENIYMKGFLKDIYLRPSCYSCKFKKPITSADITLADYWGIQDKHKKFDDDKGVSLILVNSKRGQDILKKLSNKMEMIETDLKHAINCNPSIVKHVKYNKNRDKFFKELGGNNLEELILKYTKISISTKIKNKILSILSRIKKVLFN